MIHFPERVNDFAFKIATPNGTGLGERQRPAHAGHLPHGHSRLGQERLPVEHPGPADLVRDPRQQGRPHGARARLRPRRRAQSGDLREGRRRGAPGRLPALRLVVAADAGAHARRTSRSSAFRSAQMCNEAFAGDRERIAACATSRTPARWRRCSRSTWTSSRDAAQGDLREEGGAARVERQGASSSATTTPRRTSSARCRSSLEQMDATDGHILIDGNTAAALGARVRRRDRRRVVSDHAVDVADGSVQGFCEQFRVEPRRHASATRIAAGRRRAVGRRHGDRRRRGRARASFTSTAGPGISLMSEFVGLAYYAEIPGGLLRHAAHRSVHGHADAHAAGRPLLVRVRVARRHQAHLLCSRRIRKSASRCRRRSVRSRRALPDAGVRGVAISTSA